MWDVGQDANGVFLDIGRPRYVSRDHVQIERMPGRPDGGPQIVLVVSIGRPGPFISRPKRDLQFNSKTLDSAGHR